MKSSILLSISIKRFFRIAVLRSTLTCLLVLLCLAYNVESTAQADPPDSIVNEPPKKGEVLPLDPWLPIEPLIRESTPSIPKEDIEEEILEDTVSTYTDDSISPERENVLSILDKFEHDDQEIDVFKNRRKSEDIDLTQSRKVRLNAIQRARLAAVNERKRKHVINEVRAAREERIGFDARGTPDLRVCSVNMNNYGSNAVVLANAGIGEILKQSWKESSVINAIREASCDVVYIQGLLGTDQLNAKQVFGKLADALNDQYEGVWNGYIGATNHVNIYSGYLVNVRRVEVLAGKSYTDLTIPRDDFWEAHKMLRAPFELTIRQVKRDGGSDKRIILLGVDLSLEQDLIKSENPDVLERFKMNQARRVLDLARERQVQDNMYDEPIFVLLGNLADTSYSPTSYVLTARLDLSDFNTEDGCSLDDNQGIVCNRDISRPPELYPLIANNVWTNPDLTRASQNHKSLKVDFYVNPKDLFPFWKKHNTPASYNVGFVSVKNGLADSPLAWMEINSLNVVMPKINARLEKIEHISSWASSEDSKVFYVGTEAQRRRLNREMEVRREALIYNKEFIQKAREWDSRGESEVRVCSVNLNNYGIASQVQLIVQREAVNTLPEKEKSIIEGIVSSNCDIVAVQGIIGRDYDRAIEGVQRLVRLLSRITQDNWQGLLGETNHKNAYNGFLLKSDIANVLSTKAYVDLLLPRFGKFQQDKFLRTPFELSVRVSGKGESGPRQLVLISMDLKDSVKERAKEPEALRMQMAEGLRQLVKHNKENLDSKDETIFILLVDRISGEYSPTSFILSGRMRLTDFGIDGNCILNEDDEVECGEKVNHPNILYGIIANNLHNPKVRAMLSLEERSIPKSLATNRASIYVSSKNLSYFWG
jgi:hypothetical protein